LSTIIVIYPKAANSGANRASHIGQSDRYMHCYLRWVPKTTKKALDQKSFGLVWFLKPRRYDGKMHHARQENL